MKIPFQLTAAVEVGKRREHMISAISRGLPRLQDTPIDDRKTLHVACYGPSLRDTWQALEHPCISMSGATRFLHEKGFTPDYHVDMDPRLHKVKHITPPIPGVTYLIASVCAPIYFDTLKDEKVLLWHAVSASEEEDLNWVYEHDPGQLVITTGSNVGLGAIQIGGLLGFRHFEIHGMDGSFADGVRHAASHDGKVQKPDQVWQVFGKKYYTSKIMANGVAETINSARVYPIFTVFHGEGLTQALIRKEKLPNSCTVDETDKVRFIRKANAIILDTPPTDKSKISTWSAWEGLCFSEPDPAWLEELQPIFIAAEERRKLAKFNTGSISLETGLLLRAVCQWRKPKVIVEIGTFIGRSTAALKGDAIYTCDKDNDCLEGSETVKVHPFHTSTQLLRKLVDQGVKVDLFFFDGRLSDEDIPLVMELAKTDTLFAFDDFHLGGKGLANIEKLQPVLPNYGLVPPYEAFGDRTTLALLIPLKAREVAA